MYFSFIKADSTKIYVPYEVMRELDKDKSTQLNARIATRFLEDVSEKLLDTKVQGWVGVSITL